MENTMLIQLLTHLIKTLSDEDAKTVIQSAKPELMTAPEGAIVVEQTHDWFDVVSLLVDTDRPDHEKLPDVVSSFVDSGYSLVVGRNLCDDTIKNLIDNDDDLYAAISDHIIDRDAVIEWLQMNI